MFTRYAPCGFRQPIPGTVIGQWLANSRSKVSFTCLARLLEAAFTRGGSGRHHQGRTMVMFRGYLAHRGHQSRPCCIYWLCSSSQARLSALYTLPFSFNPGVSRCSIYYPALACRPFDTFRLPASSYQSILLPKFVHILRFNPRHNPYA